MPNLVTLNEREIMSWERVEPPLWWAAISDYVIADRHLADGTRQHMIRGHAEPGLVVANAQVIGEDDCQDVHFATALSHLLQ